MRYLEAPKYSNELRGEKIFLAGGITNCYEWQYPAAQELLDRTDLSVLNPRRKDFDVSNLSDSAEQIKWEHYYLRKADRILFWFPKTSICPISL